MTFLFCRAIALGDNVVAIKAMFMLKAMYPKSTLIVATNALGENLYRHLPFIDSVITDLSQNRHKIDYLIITHRTKANIALAKQTNARKIITKAHLHTLFSPRFINDFQFSTKRFYESWNLLRLIRLIDKNHFEQTMQTIDFSEAKLRCEAENERFVEDFLESNKLKIANGGGQQQDSKLIGINFFGSGGVKYLSLPAWRRIIMQLANNFKHYHFIVLCPPNQVIEEFRCENIAIFVNNSDLLNLVAMTKRLNLLISVDTGNVHIADNLQIPTLGLYTQEMFRRWRGGSYGGIFKGLIIKDDEVSTEAEFLAMALDLCREIG